MTTDTTPHRPSPTATGEVPLALWPVAQRTAQAQRAGRYLPEVAAHPGKMLPELARRIISEYSAPGELVCDPLAGIGTTVVEAALLARQALGVELEPRWARLAEANLDHMLDARTRHLAEIRRGDARRLTGVLEGEAGTVDLVVTSPPYGCDAGIFDPGARARGDRSCVAESLNYSTNRANLGHARGRAYEDAMADVYAQCRAVLAPGGRLVVVTKNTRRGGATFDLAGLTVALATAAGFSYLGHVVALHAAIRDGGLIARPSFWQTIQVKRARERGEPAHLVAHEDVAVFVAPTTTKENARAH
jgi:modification methylase